MIANYKGKDFFGISRGRDLIELRSSCSEDNTFVYNDGIYTKCVKKAECSNVRRCWLFATYEDEYFEVQSINCDTEQILVVMDISSIYMSELMDMKSAYDMGREIYGWCDINKFSSFYILFDDYSNHTDNNKRVIDRSEIIEYMKLLVVINNT